MAKERRGWRGYTPSVNTIVKVFVALVAIKLVSRVVMAYVPPSISPFWPTV